jgi:hypothetical protein
MASNVMTAMTAARDEHKKNVSVIAMQESFSGGSIVTTIVLAAETSADTSVSEAESEFSGRSRTAEAFAFAWQITCATGREIWQGLLRGCGEVAKTNTRFP